MKHGYVIIDDTSAHGSDHYSLVLESIMGTGISYMPSNSSTAMDFPCLPDILCPNTEALGRVLSPIISS